MNRFWQFLAQLLARKQAIKGAVVSTSPN